MDFNPVVLAIPLYFLLIGIELIWEATSRKGVYRVGDAITNLSCGISSQVTGAIWNVLSVAMYSLVYSYSIFKIQDTWWTWIIFFILIDLMYYWYHRASHEINFMWNVSHVVHHQSEDYNLSVALRQASFGGVFSMVFYLPLALIGFSPVGFVILKGFNLIYQFWIHTEAINKLPRWFEYVFNTPSHHRVHHGRNPKYIDRNHAGTLMIWDRMFGTFQEEEEKPTYGVTKPINTWNPLWANVLPIVEMAKQFGTTKGFSNKLKVLFYKPGWHSKDQGGYQEAPAITGDEVKYSSGNFQSLNAYIVAQYIFLLAVTTYFLLNHQDFSIVAKSVVAVYIMVTIIVFGLLLERRSGWHFVEIVRALSLVIISYFFFEQLLLPISVVSTLYLLAFIIPFRSYAKTQ